MATRKLDLVIPYYEEAKKYHETFSEEKSKYLAQAIPNGPSTDADFRELDLRLKEFQVNLAPSLVMTTCIIIVIKVRSG